MAVYLVQDKSVIAHLFDGWEETMIWSCLQGYMGIAYADSLTAPTAAQISLGDFCFFAGAVNIELLQNKPTNLQGDEAIFVPQNAEWEKAIEQVYEGKAQRFMRYATKKEEDNFDMAKLEKMVLALPNEFTLKRIDEALYEVLLSLDWARDLCSNYKDFAQYEKIGLGFVVLHGNTIISGASSYTSFQNGIEIEIDTRQDYRRKGLAMVCGAAIISECLQMGWYPSWDAHNKGSLALAEKLGYVFDKQYPVYDVAFA